jgi:hypothetical protein
MAKLPGAYQQSMNDCKDVATAYDQLGAATRAVGPLTQKSGRHVGAEGEEQAVSRPLRHQGQARFSVWVSLA